MIKKAIVLLILLIGIITGCSDKGVQIKKTDNVDGLSEETEYQIYKMPYVLENGLSFSCIQVRNIGDDALEKRINNSLQRHFCMLKPAIFEVDKTVVYEPVVHMQTSEYLSVEYIFQENSEDFEEEYWHLCITVDMQSGDEIFIDDLLEINEGLVRLVKDGGVLKMDEGTYLTAEEATRSENKFFSEETMEYVQEFLEFFTEENLYQDNYSDVYAIEQFFYLEDGTICFRAPNSGERTKKGEIVRIMANDVKEYLKVPVWGNGDQGSVGEINKEPEAEAGYYYEVIGYNIYETSYMLDNGYSFTNIQVCDMRDKKLESKINASLNKYFYILEEPWFIEEKIELYKLIVHYQSFDFLSVEYIFNYVQDDTYDSYLHLCVTVDVQSGEVVFLDDLIKLDESFAETVISDGILKREANFYYTGEENTKRANEYMSDMGSDYILNFFEEFSEEKLYGGEYYKQEDHAAPWGEYIYRTYFYLEEDSICCNTVWSGQSTYRIMLEDIEEHLKVLAW